MTDPELTLGVALGFETPPGKDTSLVRDVTKTVEFVSQLLDKFPLLRAFTLTPDVVQQIASFLTQPVSALALGAWNKRSEIRKYADLETYPKGSRNKVGLIKHELKQTVKPTVSITLGASPPVKFGLTASVTFTFQGAKLIIEDAKITHVELGEVSASIDLSAEKAEMVKHKLGPWSLPGVYRLREPIEITRPN